jgi:hypothetical protein
MEISAVSYMHIGSNNHIIHKADEVIASSDGSQ